MKASSPLRVTKRNVIISINNTIIPHKKNADECTMVKLSYIEPLTIVWMIEQRYHHTLASRSSNLFFYPIRPYRNRVSGLQSIIVVVKPCSKCSESDKPRSKSCRSRQIGAPDFLECILRFACVHDQSSEKC